MVNVALIKFIDKVIGSIINLFLGIFSRKKEIDLEKPKKILFIQLWSIGETILTLPAIYDIKKKYKDSEIYVLATDRNRDVYLSADKAINILTIKLNPLSILRLIFFNFRKFDIVFDLEEYLNISSTLSYFLGKQRMGFSGKVRSLVYNKTVEYNDKQHVTETFLDLARLIGADYEALPKLSYNKSTKVERILGGKTIAIAPGAAESAKSRMWPADNFVKLSNELTKDYNLVFIGSEKEKQLIDSIMFKIKDKDKVINLAGEISINELFNLIDNVNLLITNDTGPLHIASAQKTKTIALFGPNTPVRFGTYNKDSISIYKQESCAFSPCINVHLGKVPDCLYPKNSKDYQKCMKSILVEEVLDAVRKLA
jgi:ADP-heptose:LPS heptosyltransferase